MHITLAAIGKMKAGPEKALFDSYCKRLPWQVTLKEFEAKKGLQGEPLKQAEASLLHNAIPTGSKTIVLDERGKHLSSMAFSRQLSQWQNEGFSQLAILIGGADGHSGTTRQCADLLLSFGAMTWPHMLVRPMLAEQLYRAYTIQQNHPYHRE